MPDSRILNESQSQVRLRTTGLHTPNTAPTPDLTTGYTHTEDLVYMFQGMRDSLLYCSRYNEYVKQTWGLPQQAICLLTVFAAIGQWQRRLPGGVSLLLLVVSGGKYLNFFFNVKFSPLRNVGN